MVWLWQTPGLRQSNNSEQEHPFTHCRQASLWTTTSFANDRLYIRLSIISKLVKLFSITVNNLTKLCNKKNPGSVPLSRCVAQLMVSLLWPILCPSLVEFSSFWVIQPMKGKWKCDLHLFMHMVIMMMIKAPLTGRIQILWEEDWSLKKSAEMIQHRTAGHFINNLNRLRYDW